MKIPNYVDDVHDFDDDEADAITYTETAAPMKEEDEIEIKQIKIVDMGDQIQKVRDINLRFNVTLTKNMDIIPLSVIIIKITKLKKELIMLKNRRGSFIIVSL